MLAEVNSNRRSSNLARFSLNACNGFSLEV